MKFILVLVISLILQSCVTTISQNDVITNGQSGTEVINTTKSTYLFSNSDYWNSIADEISRSHSKTIMIHLNGEGGYVEIGNIVNNAIDSAISQGKRVIIIVDTRAQSAFAMTLCHASSYEMGSGAFLMFHATYNSVVGYEQNTSDFTDCTEKGIISSSELDRINIQHLQLIITSDGRRVWAPDVERH